MNRSLMLVPALSILVLVSPAFGQAGVPAKPVSRADFTKTLDNRFNSLDTNHDGKVTRDELASEEQREVQRARAQITQQLQAKFKQLDTNKDGQLSLQEFLAATPAVRAGESPDQILQRLDSNHDGKVTADEFRAPELAKFSRVDANHDGVVTPEELKAAGGKK